MLYRVQAEEEAQLVQQYIARQMEERLRAYISQVQMVMTDFLSESIVFLH